MDRFGLGGYIEFMKAVRTHCNRSEDLNQLLNFKLKEKFMSLRQAVLVPMLLILGALNTGITKASAEEQPPEIPETIHLVGDSDAAKIKDTETPFAVINADGTPARGNGVVSSARLFKGHYQVIFSRDVTACVYSATLGRPNSVGVEPSGEITVAGRSGNKKGVFVATNNSAGVSTDHNFHLLVTCIKD